MSVESPPRYWFPKPYADFVQRLRVASGFLLLVTFAWAAHPTPGSLVAGVPVSLVGLFIRAWAAGHLAKNQQLAVSGPYAWVRNPLYLGTLFGALGVVIACRSAALATIVIVVFLGVYLPVIELEEQHLRAIFPSYASYAARVRRLLPVTRWPGQRANFSWSLYGRNQEWKALGGYLLALLWMIWRCWSPVIRFR